jgi:hypothetical protein
VTYTDEDSPSLGGVVTVDLDSTLCDTRPRRHLLGTAGDPASWVDYSMACAGDGIIHATARLVEILNRCHDIHIVTGRNEEARPQTEQWLRENHIQYEELHMLPVGYSERCTPEDVKVMLLRKIILARHPVLLHVDDWPPTRARLAEELSIYTLVVTPPEIVEKFDPAFKHSL